MRLARIPLPLHFGKGVRSPPCFEPAPRPDTHPCSLILVPWRASRGGNASYIAFSLIQPPKRLTLPLRPRQKCRPGRLGAPPVGACDSGLSQAEAGCQRHSLGHEESHSSIYRQRNCWPSLAGRLQPLRWGCGGMGAARPGLG